MAKYLPKHKMIARLKAAHSTRFYWNAKMRVKCPSIDVMAKFIKELWPRLTVTVEPTSETKDTKLAGTRLRRQGRTYHGKLLTVKQSGKLLLNHSTVDTYRHNAEVAYWITHRLESQPKKGGHGEKVQSPGSKGVD